MNTPARAAWLRTLAERSLHPLTVERVIAPAFEDLDHECATGSSRRTRLGAYAAVIKTIVVCTAVDAMRDRERHSRSLLGRFTAAIAVIAGLMLLPNTLWHLRFASTAGAAAALTAYSYQLASALAVALPFALFFALAFHRFRLHEPAERLLPSALGGVILSTLAMIPLLATVAPTANQAYRELVFASLTTDGRSVTIAPGAAEMTLPELNEFIRNAPSRRAEDGARTHRHSRFALIAAVVVLGALGFSLAGRWRSRAVTLGASIGLFIAYVFGFSLHWPGQGQQLSMWTTNAVFLAVALVLMRARGRSAGGVVHA